MKFYIRDKLEQNNDKFYPLKKKEIKDRRQNPVHQNLPKSIGLRKQSVKELKIDSATIFLSRYVLPVLEVKQHLTPCQTREEMHLFG